MPNFIKTVLIGIFVIIASAIVVSLLLYIHPSVGDNAKTLRMRFTDLDKVDIGTRVTYAGRPVGEVVSIREIPDARTSRKEHDGDVYVYELEVKVDSGVDVFNTDEVLVRTSGLLGEKNIEINPLPPKPGQDVYKIEDQVLYAVPSGSVESALKSLDALSKKIERTLDDVQGVITTIRKEEVVEKIAKVTQNLVDITHALNQPEKWRQALDNAVATCDNANKSLINVRDLTQNAKQSWPKIDHTINQITGASDQIYTASINVNQFTGTARNLMEQTSCGQGTLGQLFVGNDLYLKIKSILHKGNTLMDDINQYGLLFQTNKRWQRKEAERRQLVQTLSNPCQFYNYFNMEMDQIQNSISTVTMILNESDCNPQSLLYNPDFTYRFAELLKQTEAMEDTLKLYNEQLIGQD